MHCRIYFVQVHRFLTDDGENSTVPYPAHLEWTASRSSDIIHTHSISYLNQSEPLLTVHINHTLWNGEWDSDQWNRIRSNTHHFCNDTVHTVLTSQGEDTVLQNLVIPTLSQRRERKRGRGSMLGIGGHLAGLDESKPAHNGLLHDKVTINKHSMLGRRHYYIVLLSKKTI